MLLFLLSGIQLYNNCIILIVIFDKDIYLILNRLVCLSISQMHASMHIRNILCMFYHIYIHTYIILCIYAIKFITCAKTVHCMYGIHICMSASLVTESEDLTLNTQGIYTIATII